MNGMCKVFLTVCDMSVTAVFAIVLVLIARLLLRKVPRRFSYYLWIIVAFRLICPYSFTSEISIFNLGIFGGHMTGNQAGQMRQEYLTNREYRVRIMYPGQKVCQVRRMGPGQRVRR